MNKSAKVITANTLILKDREGKTRIYLDAADQHGMVTIMLVANNDSSISLSSDPQGHCSISIKRQDGKICAVLGTKPDYQSGFEIYDSKGCPWLEVSSANEDQAARVVVFEKGRRRELFTAKPGATSRRKRGRQ